jgi:hypothetical protein
MSTAILVRPDPSRPKGTAHNDQLRLSDKLIVSALGIKIPDFRLQIELRRRARWDALRE